MRVLQTSSQCEPLWQTSRMHLQTSSCFPDRATLLGRSAFVLFLDLSGAMQSIVREGIFGFVSRLCHRSAGFPRESWPVTLGVTLGAPFWNRWRLTALIEILSSSHAHLVSSQVMCADSSHMQCFTSWLLFGQHVVQLRLRQDFVRG